MIECYDPIAPERGLLATREEYNALKAAFEADPDYSGFEIEYNDGVVYVFASESGYWEELSPRFLAVLGTLIAKNSLDYLEFGRSEGGHPRNGIVSELDAYFRVGTDGSLLEPKGLLW